MTYTLPIGSISHGTLRPSDLADALLPLAEAAGLGPAPLRELADVIDTDGECADAAEIISDVMDDLQEFAPAYCYVGFHVGDGSDLGVWPDWNAIESAVHDGEILKIADLADLDDLPADDRGYELALLVNDHGNASLYPLRLTAGDSVWAVV